MEKLTESEFAEYLLHLRGNREPVSSDHGSRASEDLATFSVANIPPPVHARPGRQLLVDSISLSDPINMDDQTKLHAEDMVEDVVDVSHVVDCTIQPAPVYDEILITGDQDCSGGGPVFQGSASAVAPNEESSKKVMDNKEELLVALKSSFSKLTTIGNELQEYALLVQRHRYFVSKAIRKGEL